MNEIKIDNIKKGDILKFKNDPIFYIVSKITDNCVFATGGTGYPDCKIKSIVIKRNQGNL